MRRAWISWTLFFLMTAAATWAGAGVGRPSLAPSSVRQQASSRQDRSARHNVVLFGDKSVESRSGRAAAGSMKAIRFADKATGTAHSISVYIASHNAAKTMAAGLYTNKRGRTGSLLASGSRSSLKPGAWNTVTIKSAKVEAGRDYWVAVLAKGGTLHFRHRANDSCRRESLAESHLTALPRSARKARRSNTCPISAYVSGEPAAATRGPVHATLAPVNIAPPVVTGTAQRGDVLSSSVGSWTGSPTSYGYQWQDCSGSCTNVSGATSSTYTLVSGDVGDRIGVVVTATNAGGSTAASSAQTGAVTAGSGAMDGISVSGNHLVTGGGQTVTLHGVDRSGTEYTCTEGNGIFDGPSGNSEFSPMPSWDINSVFIGLNEDCWLGINGSGINNWSADSGQNYINAIKAEVTAAEANGLYPVIGWFWGDPGTEVPNGNDPNGGGQPPMPDNDHAPLFWEEVADTFKSDPNVIFRLQEEPHPFGAAASVAAWKCWSQGDVQYSMSSVNADGTAPTAMSSNKGCSDTEYGTNGTSAYSPVGMQSLINIVRGTGASNVIQAPGLAYANMAACSSTGSPTTCGMLDTADGVRLSDPYSSSNPQLMADFDMYPDQGQECETATCYSDTLAPVAAVMPLDLGEIGPSGSVDTQADVLLNWMDSLNPKGSYYAWAWDTWANLIASYSGTPTASWGTAYYDRLTDYTPPPPAQPTNGMTIRQVTQGLCVSPPSSTIALNSAVSVGDDLFIVVGGQGYTGAAPTVSSVSDNVNGAWTQLTDSGSQSLDGVGYASYAVYEMLNSKAAASGLTITIKGVSGQSGMSGEAIDIGGASVSSSAFDSTVKGSGGGAQQAATFTGPSLSSVPADDLVLGLYGSYSHSYQGFSTPTGWNTSANYWTTSQTCGAAAIDWTQPVTTGSLPARITSSATEYHYSGAIDLHPAG